MLENVKTFFVVGEKGEYLYSFLAFSQNNDTSFFKHLSEKLSVLAL